MFHVDVVVRSNDDILQSLVDEGLVRYYGTTEVCSATMDVYEGRQYYIFSLEDPLDPYPEANTGIYVPKEVGETLAPKVALFALWFADTDYWHIDYDSYADSWEVEEARENYNYITKCVSKFGMTGRIVEADRVENAVTIRVWW